MRFATSTQNPRVYNYAEKVSAKIPFSYAMIYPIGWINQGKPYELTDFGYENQDNAKRLCDALGVILPHRILFSCGPSHLYAVAYYDDNFTVEMFVNTVDFITMTAPHGSAYFLKNSEFPLFITKSGTTYYKELLKNHTTFAVSEGTYDLVDDVSVETSAALLRDILVNYWIDKPGFTDGPDEGSSLQDITNFLRLKK